MYEIFWHVFCLLKKTRNSKYWKTGIFACIKNTHHPTDHNGSYLFSAWEILHEKFNENEWKNCIFFKLPSYCWWFFFKNTVGTEKSVNWFKSLNEVSWKFGAFLGFNLQANLAMLLLLYYRDDWERLIAIFAFLWKNLHWIWNKKKWQLDLAIGTHKVALKIKNSNLYLKICRNSFIEVLPFLPSLSLSNHLMYEFSRIISCSCQKKTVAIFLHPSSKLTLSRIFPFFNFFINPARLFWWITRTTCMFTYPIFSENVKKHFL